VARVFLDEDAKARAPATPAPMALIHDIGKTPKGKTPKGPGGHHSGVVRAVSVPVSEGSSASSSASSSSSAASAPAPGGGRGKKPTGAQVLAAADVAAAPVVDTSAEGQNLVYFRTYAGAAVAARAAGLMGQASMLRVAHACLDEFAACVGARGFASEKTQRAEQTELLTDVSALMRVVPPGAAIELLEKVQLF
jgi:hypothetical protein